jgi:L-alanine-DL-glutamate epimerase-like enolase superfamily enzyme
MPARSRPRKNADQTLTLVARSSFAPSTPSHAKVEDTHVSAYTVPTDLPESDGTLAWDKTTIVVVEVRSRDTRGLGYSYADLSTANLIRDRLGHVIRGKNVMDVSGCWFAMVSAIRNLGRPGIGSMAISAVDIALWDLKARLLGVPLVTLLGAVRDEVPVYGSGGFTSYSIEQLQSQLAGWASAGFQMVKMKIGRDPQDDLARVRAARDAIGAGVQLFVDANGAYSRKQALHFTEQFRQYGIRWFEEPVSSDDLEGLRLLRDRAPAGMEIAAGEYGYDGFYFRRMLEAGAVDVLQADATRCGGITGFVQASELCLAHSVPLSSHTAPALHTHLGCAVQPLRHIEYFHDHVRIEEMFFDGTPKPVNGKIRPDLQQPGLGLVLRRADAKKYAIT